MMMIKKVERCEFGCEFCGPFAMTTGRLFDYNGRLYCSIERGRGNNNGPTLIQEAPGQNRVSAKTNKKPKREL